jgi:hypothetical protein
MEQRIEYLKANFPSIEDVIKNSNLTEKELAWANYSGNSSLLIGGRAAIRKELVANLFNTRLDGTKWVPNWKKSEPKWSQWFNMDANTPSGVGFSGSFYVYWGSYSDCGSRLVFEDEQLSDLAAEMYPEIFIESLTK